jgi:hypothetical protein
VQNTILQQDLNLQELRKWKESAMEAMADFQEIGKELGVGLGKCIGKEMLPSIRRLKSKLQGTEDVAARLQKEQYDLHDEINRLSASNSLLKARVVMLAKAWREYLEVTGGLAHESSCDLVEQWEGTGDISCTCGASPLTEIIEALTSPKEEK